jgi:O-antigen ligase
MADADPMFNAATADRAVSACDEAVAGPVDAKRSRVGRCVVVAVVVFLFASELALYLFETGHGPPVSFFIALTAMLAVMVVARSRAGIHWLTEPVIRWALVYVAVSLAWGLAAPPQFVVDRIRSAVLLASVVILLDHAAVVHVARLAFGAVVLLATGLNVYDTVYPLTFSNTVGRAAGFYVNPNGAGLAIAFGVALATPALPRRARIPFVLTALVGCLLTLSRGGILCLTIGVVGLVATRVLAWRPVVAALAVAVAAGAVAASQGLLDDVATLVQNNGDVQGRLSFQTDDYSTAERSEVAAKAIGMFLDAPLLGSGTGASLSWNEEVSSHNQALNLAVDHGVFGLALVLGLVVALVRRNPDARVFAIVFCAAMMFSHNLLDSFHSLVALAIGASLRWRRSGEPAA